MIFGSTYNFLHNFKHSAKKKIAQKEKRKRFFARRAAWNLARKPAHARSACSRAAQTARVDTVHSGPSASRARALSLSLSRGR